MVMIEALACGTPVIAFPEGAVPEVVHDGETGFLVADETEMARAVGRLRSISPARCRAWVSDHCDAAVVAADHERLYRSVTTRRVAATLHG
jgi:glycosyltransferase involved in cell wall biosynthesis